MSDPHIFDAQTVVKRARDIIFQQFDDELLAVDVQSGQCYSLNESAGRIWQLIETPASLNVICAQLVAEYNVDETLCLREVTALLHALNEAGLVITDGNAAQ